jgi:fibronectin type 3 domain-containing protein
MPLIVKLFILAQLIVSGTAQVSGNSLKVTVGTKCVTLRWVKSTSLVVGYYVYRSTKSGGPYARINHALVVQPPFTDVNVMSGVTYYYVSTSVDTYSQESRYSNQVQATVN